MTEAAIEEAQPLSRVTTADWVTCQLLLGAPDVRFANAALQGHEGVENASKPS